MDYVKQLLSASSGRFRAHPASRAGAARLVTLAVSATLGLVSTRLIFETAGVGAYAAMTMLASTFALIPFVDLGTGAAVTNSMAESESFRDDENVKATVLSAARVLMAATAVVCLCSIGLWLSMGTPLILGDVANEVPGSSFWFPLGLFLFGSSLTFGVAQRVLLGAGAYHRALYCQLSSPVAVLASVMVFSQLQVPVACVIALPGLGAIVSALVTLGVARRSLKWNFLPDLRTLLNFRGRRGGPIMQLAWPMIVIMTGLAVALQADRLILAHVASPLEVAEYSVSSQLYIPLWSVISASALAMWPIFARHRSAGTIVSREYWRVAGLAFAGSGVAAGLLVVAGPLLTNLISGGKVVVDVWTLFGFAALMLVQGAHVISGMLLTDEAGLWFQAKCVVAMLFFNIPLSVWSAMHWGASGPVFASAVSVFIAQAVPGQIRARRTLRNVSTEPA